MAFSSTSRHISYCNDGTLSAMCQANNGSWRWSEINLDNYMTVNRNGMPGRARQQGAGDFSRRARNVRVNPNTGAMEGNATTSNGATTEFGVRLDRYISNIDGRLVWTANINPDGSVNPQRPTNGREYDL